ncbi:hypothetical protein OUZ56_016468 [Daphnia magna]|uniref:Uncharacterized protein n=1 Tax=Daphnia magna TaxID=35525 RepID=A0ABR0AQN4_9CRUS|nr:hypothetical protein OUZ56_016468 [Daphnia magna]
MFKYKLYFNHIYLLRYHLLYAKGKIEKPSFATETGKCYVTEIQPGASDCSRQTVGTEAAVALWYSILHKNLNTREGRRGDGHIGQGWTYPTLSCRVHHPVYPPP